MGLRVKVCRAADVPAGDVRGFEVEGVGVPILVANIDGALFATSSICPHEDVSLLDGDRDGATIECPGHAYQFDLRTGRCAHDPDLHLPCYRVTVIDGDIYVDLIA